MCFFYWTFPRFKHFFFIQARAQILYSRSQSEILEKGIPILHKNNSIRSLRRNPSSRKTIEIDPPPNSNSYLSVTTDSNFPVKHQNIDRRFFSRTATWEIKLIEFVSCVGFLIDRECEELLLVLTVFRYYNSHFSLIVDNLLLQGLLLAFFVVGGKDFQKIDFVDHVGIMIVQEC